MTDTTKKLEHLREKIKTSDFQHSRGLSNEVSYYILAYDSKDAPMVSESIVNMKNQLNKETVGVDIVEFNVYQIMWELIDQMDIRDEAIKMETEDGIDYLAEQLNNALEMTNSENELVKYMENKLGDRTDVVVFVTGIGQVYPLLRAHKVLNTMHQIIDNIPVVLFYPGKYDRLSLSMFGEAKEDNYYRAFQIN